MKLTMQELMDSGIPRKTCLKIAREASKIRNERIKREQAIQNEMAKQRDIVNIMLQREKYVTNERSMPRRPIKTNGKCSNVKLQDGRIVSPIYFSKNMDRIQTIAIKEDRLKFNPMEVGQTLTLTDSDIAKARGDRRRAA